MTEIPEDFSEKLIVRILREIRGECEKLKPYSMRFEETFIRADLTLDREPEIAPNGEIGVHIELRNNRSYDNFQQAVRFRWLLPEGFEASGKKTALLQRYDDHNEPTVELDAVIKAGEYVATENRIILEITVPGRHTALYASFILFGC